MRMSARDIWRAALLLGVASILASCAVYEPPSAVAVPDGYYGPAYEEPAYPYYDGPPVVFGFGFHHDWHHGGMHGWHHGWDHGGWDHGGWDHGGWGHGGGHGHH